MEGALARLLVVISPNYSLGSLDTYLTREREDCEAISRAVATDKMTRYVRVAKGFSCYLFDGYKWLREG